MAKTLRYIRNVPRQLPKDGSVIVHNWVHATHRAQKPGLSFRCWIAKLSDCPKAEQCECGWSGLAHYRISRSGYPKPPRVQVA